MKCDLCNQEFVETKNVLAELLMHKVAIHGDSVNEQNTNMSSHMTTRGVGVYANPEEFT